METNINQAAEAPEQQLLPCNQALTSGDFKTMEESELNHFAIFERLQKYIYLDLKIEPEPSEVFCIHSNFFLIL